MYPSSDLTILLSKLSLLQSSDQARALDLLREKERRRYSNLATYRPYAKQREFHALGLTKRERLLRAGNQNGKTYCGGAEVAYHLTGRYPDWWEGRRWDRPIMAWASGNTGELARDNPQRVLFGPVGEFGAGLVPDWLIGSSRPAMGVAELRDYVKVKHASGGWSTVRFKHYSQGREKWQGPPIDLVWFDEEPPQDIYSEGLARTIATGGSVFLTFTPLLGMSDVVRRYLMESSDSRADVNMTIEDAEHIPKEERARIISSFPAHERDARAKGIPILGSGRAFPVSEDFIAFDAFSYPGSWYRIGGIDFGWDHPTAAVLLVEDRDSDTLYVVNAYRRSEATPMHHSVALKAWGNFPFSWPHDGLQHDKTSGMQLSEQYRQHGLDMLHERATFPDGTNGVEAGVQEMLERMETGRLKVARHLTDWFEEFMLYHRKDGQIVKSNDDLIDATRYAMMMRRYGRPAHVPYKQQHNHAQISGSGGWMKA